MRPKVESIKAGFQMRRGEQVILGPALICWGQDLRPPRVGEAVLSHVAGYWVLGWPEFMPMDDGDQCPHATLPVSVALGRWLLDSN